jgi:hypothetical protein
MIVVVVVVVHRLWWLHMVAMRRGVGMRAASHTHVTHVTDAIMCVLTKLIR